MKKKRFLFFLNGIIILLLFTACNSDVFYQKDFSIEGSRWEQDKKYNFVVPVKDTLKVYDFYIDIRNTEDYPYSNVFFLLKTTFPSGEYANDTIECSLAYPDGHWTGKNSGSILDNRFLFKRQVIFPMSGNYVFEIQQGMRDSVLIGVHDIGLRICNAKKN